MAKRFINPDWKALRKLPSDLQRAWFYIWDKADEAGVYHYDPDYLKLDLNLGVSLSLMELSTLPECEIMPGERILIKNFIAINFKNLKPDYNPHKPAYRDIEKNKLKLNLSLNQACFKLEEEDKEEGKGEEEFKIGDGFFLNEIPMDTELTKIQKINVIEFIKVVCNGKVLSEADVGEHWKAFKIDNLNKKQWQNSYEDVLSFFRHTLKNHLTNKNGSTTFKNSSNRTEITGAGDY